MANPVQQIFLWVVELLSQIGNNWASISLMLTGVAGAYLAYVLWRQLQGEDVADVRYESSSAAGSTSIRLSGTHLTMLLAGVIGLLLWPAPLETPTLGMVLLGAVMLHYVVERRGVGA